jgi:5'-3' exonuclease
MRILLVDISSVAYPIFHVSGKEPDQDYVSKATVARVHSEAQAFDHTIVCCDGPKNFRKQISPEYKANRESNEVVKHQLRLAQEQLAEDGFQVWKVDGFEADDLISSTVAHLRSNGADLADSDRDVTILSGDKDLTVLVGHGVKMKTPAKGDVYDREAVKAKFGVYPERMTDLLCLMGDSSDNVPGVPGLGKVKGAELLNKHGSLLEIYQKLGDSCDALGLTPSTFSALKDNVATVELARKLITLRTDVELPFENIFKPRTPKETTTLQEEDMQTITTDGEVVDEKPDTKSEPAKEDWTQGAPTKFENAHLAEANARQAPSAQMVKQDWSRELEPTNLGQAMNLAKALFASRLFSAYGSPEAVLATILAGRELGIGTMAALKGYHIIEGKPSMSADLMAALVKRSGLCKQFEIIERTNERATIRVWRVGEENYKDVAYSVDDAKKAKTWKAGGGWEKNPADMCVARVKAIGARLKWEDVIGGVYTPEEMGREDLEEAA